MSTKYEHSVVALANKNIEIFFYYSEFEVRGTLPGRPSNICRLPLFGIVDFPIAYLRNILSCLIINFSNIVYNRDYKTNCDLIIPTPD